MKRIMKKLMVLGMAAMLTAAAGASYASAKTVTVKSYDFTTKLSSAKKMAKKVTKGTTTLVLTAKSKNYASSGFVKFTAPKTKTYKFTFSSAKGIGEGKGDTFTGFNYIMTSTPYGSIGQTMVTTQGGKATALWTGSTNRKVYTDEKLVDRNLHSRYGKIRLKKGQTVFLYMYHSCKKVSLKLNIK